MEKMLLEYPSGVEIVKPSSPECPFIQLIENRERSYFEAVFCLELTGVVSTARELEKAVNRTNESEAAGNSSHNSLLSGMSDKQELDFIYRGGRDADGSEGLGIH